MKPKRSVQLCDHIQTILIWSKDKGDDTVNAMCVDCHFKGENFRAKSAAPYDKAFACGRAVHNMIYLAELEKQESKNAQ